uniref:Uncharacterized protein n=1 Tax=Corvus moneduloides TaxID=1196302 RepID=A0A8C3EUA5_CORMO
MYCWRVGFVAEICAALCVLRERVGVRCVSVSAGGGVSQNSWAQAIRRAQPPRQLGLQARATAPGSCSAWAVPRGISTCSILLWINT